MNKIKESVLREASGNQIGQMAYDAAMWYKAFFLQAIRFAECNNEDPFLLPWREHSEMPMTAERFFMILAIDHTLTNIKDLDSALRSRNDSRLKDIKEELLDKDGFYNKIHQLRNANEHKIEYELGIGHGQESFINEVSTKYGKIKTNSLWLLQVEDELFVGDVNFVEILNHMAVYRDKIIPVLEKICREYYGEVPQS